MVGRPMYEDYVQMFSNPALAFEHWFRSDMPPRWPERSSPRRLVEHERRCDWCGGRIGQVTSCPNCGGPQ